MSDRGEDDPNPEAAVKHDLTEWFKENGCKVYWDMNNRWDHPTFQTVGSTERPDLIVPDVPIGYRSNNRTLALEVKVEGGSKIFTAMHQTVRYWKRAVNGDSAFEIDGTPIEPTVFAAANDESPVGRLIDPDHLRTEWGSSEYARNEGWLPETEYNATSAMFNTALRWVSEYAENHPEETNGYGFGMLLASCLDREGPDDCPAVRYADRYYGQTKMRWQVINGGVKSPNSSLHEFR